MKRRVVCITLLLILCFSFVPEARAMATLDHFFNANFGRSYDVYSGPGKDYYRANMAKPCTAAALPACTAWTATGS